MCPASVSFAALLRFFCALPCQGKASNAPARRLSAGFPIGGVWPWAVKDGVTTRHARFIFEPEENHLSRSPGDFARVSPNHPGTGPTSPATQTGVSVVGREKYGTR
jgi:hypothetical protein